MPDSSKSPPAFRPLVTFDAEKEKDNVLVLLPDRLAVGTVPASELARLEQRLSRERVEDILGKHWTLPLSQITGVEGRTGAGKLAIETEQGAGRLEFSIDQKLVPDFIDEIRRGAGEPWDEEIARDSSLASMGGFFLLALICGGLTIFFYAGIKFGDINRAPAFIAMIVNLLGLEAFLAIGMLGTALALGAGVYKFFCPGKIIRLRK